MVIKYCNANAFFYSCNADSNKKLQMVLHIIVGVYNSYICSNIKNNSYEV